MLKTSGKVGKLHDLPSLQKLCSTRFGWPASKTLEVAQELYDGQGKKIITYPRAEVRYLPESLIPDVPKIVAGLQAGKSFSAIAVPDPPIIRKGASGSFYDKGLEGASHHAIIPNVNTVDNLREVWPRLSIDEKQLFDVIARAYLAAVMPDFRYRQTTATLDVRGFPFRATGRQPIDLGWRAAFPEWQPADEKGDEAQLLPALRNGEITKLENPTDQDKETRPPPRYNEGTLIEAMQNAWRFVDDEVLRKRLKEAKGIGTPATRAEIIGGLKKQAFLVAQGKNIVPTETGLSLFGVLKQADPSLVDPGLTAQLECLLDEVVIGKQKMIGAIDAVCDVAQRIIGRLQEGAAPAGPPLLGAAIARDAGSRPPTPAMKRFADSIAREKGVKPPPGYATTGSICRAFLNLHAPKNADFGIPVATGSKPASPTQILFAEKLAQEKGIVIPDEAKASSAAMSTWIDFNQVKKSGKSRRKRVNRPTKSIAPKSAVQRKRSRKGAANVVATAPPSTPARGNSGTDTPLRIPHGNKDAALRRSRVLSRRLVCSRGRRSCCLCFFLALSLTYAIAAYVILPRVVRVGLKILQRKSVPSFTLTGDGLPGDPVNLALIGELERLLAAFARAGWIEADPLNLNSSWGMAVAFVLNRPYPAAPFSSLYLFGRKQDVGLQKAIDMSPRKRHHIRFAS